MVLTIYAKAADKVGISIDASKTGPRSQKYVYGQFLERIGGIVNNNIWAEMLDDRKFYYPINSHPPAQPTGPSFGGVTLATECRSVPTSLSPWITREQKFAENKDEAS